MAGPTESPRTLDRMYYEWSQYTECRTRRELHARIEIQRAVDTLTRIRHPAKGEYVDVATLIDSAILKLQSTLTTLK